MEKNMGVEGRRMMTPFIITLFLYIFVGNELGMLPAVGVHFTSPTNDINVALGLSVMVAVLVYIIGVARDKDDLHRFVSLAHPARRP